MPRALHTVLLSSGLGYVARGVETWMQELFRHWPPDAGHVELWSSSPTPSSPPPLGSSRRRILPGLGRDHAWLRGRSWERRYEFEQISLLPAAIWQLRRVRADIVYCGDPALTWHLKRFQRFHGTAVIFMNGMRLGNFWANHFDGVHLITAPYLEQARLELGESLRAHFFAAPHFTDPLMFTPPSAERRLAARRQLGLPDEAFVVLTVGPLGPVSGKRADFLAAEIAQSPSHIFMLHAGAEEDGGAEIRARIEKLLPGRVRFLGSVDRPQMPTVYQSANAYGLAALAEPFSIAIAEALASGLPVVHHTDPITTWVSGPGGFPVSMTAAGAASSILERLIAEPSLYAKISESARAWAVEKYSPAGTAAEIARQFAETHRRFTIR